MQQNVGSCVCNQSVCLSLFIGELRLLMLIDISDQWFLVPFIVELLMILCLCVCFLLFFDVRCVYSLYWVYLISLGWNFPSSIFCRVGLLHVYCLNLVMSWTILFSPSLLIESFAGYSSLGCHLWSLISAWYLSRPFWLS